MTVRGLLRLLGAWLVLALVVFFAVRSWISLSPPAEATVVETRWRKGTLVSRNVRKAGDPPPAPDPSVTIVEETVVGEGPMVASPLLFTYSLVSGRDGILAEMDGKRAYLTVDDLLEAQAYDHGASLFDASLGFGTQRSLVLHMLGERLRATPGEVATRARFTRVRMERHVVGEPDKARVTKKDLTPELVKSAIAEGARYLARSVDDDGRFRYLVQATTNAVIPGYSWPRHAGATYFMAQAAALLDDADIRYAALRAAARMRDQTTKDCGDNRCVAAGDEADVGSSALAILAYAELVRTGADPSYARSVAELAKFLRAQQRPDGELMHLYKRSEKKPIDVQLLYFTGEAALALARASTITNDPADLEASKRALAHLVGPGWSFFGSRYYFSEEHWTCQTMSELWDRAPNPDALAFCLRWHQFQRAMQHEDGDSPYDADGSFGVGPVMSPRLTPASSRGEAAGATVEALDKAHGDPAEIAALDDELSRAIAFVIRQQFTPGPRHLFADPAAVRGAMPGSTVDWQLRIDYPQHAGSMMIRWLDWRARHPDAG